MSCLDFQPRTKHRRSGKGQQCGCWRFGSVLGRGWKREREREREKKGESQSGRRRSHGRYFTTSASTVPLLLVLLSVEPSRRQKRQANMAQQAKVCPLLHFGETKQDWRRMGGVSAQEQAWGPFSVRQNPNSPSPTLGWPKYPRCAVPGTSNEPRQSRLHGRRTRRAFSPTCRPTPSAQPCEPSTRTSESSGTCPTTPSHWPRRHALTVAFSSCILRMTQSTLSTGPRRSRRALVSGLAAAEIALHLGNGCTIAHPLFPPAMESIR